MQLSFGIAMHLYVQQDAGAYGGLTGNIRSRTRNVAMQFKLEALAFGAVTHHLKHRLRRAPTGITKKKSQTMPHLMVIHAHRPETATHKFEGDRTGAQPQAGRQGLIAPVQRQPLTC